MRPLAILLIVAATAAHAQMPLPNQKTEPLQFLPLDQVKEQIAAARGLPGPELPDAAARREAVAEVNGETVVLDEVLSEVINRFGSTLVPGLLNQAVMRMETVKRGTRISEEEFVEGVQLFLAQKKSIQEKKTLREILAEAKFSWTTFERMVSDQVKVHKVVRADLKLPKRKEALNPFLLQIWAGQKLQGQYSLNMDAAKLPPGILGEVSTSRAVGAVLADLAAGAYTTERVETGKAVELVVSRADGGWPRYKLPDVPIDEMMPDGSIGKTPASAMVAALLDASRPAGEKGTESYLRIRTGEDEPTLELPALEVTKQADEKSPPAPVGLGEALDAVGKQGFDFQSDGTLRAQPGSWPAYTVPVAWLVGPRPAALIELVKGLKGRPVTVEKRVRVSRRFDLPDVPVTMFSRLDRDYVLSFSYGKLEAVHYEEALKSLARYRAARQALKARDIGVDERAVQALIDAENAKYNHPLFNRKMILQAQGKTEFDEDRRLWVGNGVDQIIGTEVDEKALKEFFEANILHFGQATVEASHILAEARKDPKTGKLDYEEARKRIDKIAGELFSHPRPPVIFADLARRHSDDPMTASKGGSLGPFSLRGQMSREFAEAAFALRPGEISAPVKTAYGWHLILCTKFEPPKRDKFSLDDPETRERVVQEFQQERRDAWLEKHVYAPLKVAKLRNLVPAAK